MPTSSDGSLTRINTTGVFSLGMKTFDYIHEITNRMRFIRQIAGLSRADLSCILEKADNYISHLESHRNKLTMEEFISFIKVFHISLTKFFANNFYKIFNQPAVIEQLKLCVEKLQPKLDERKKIRYEEQKEYKRKKLKT